MVSAVKHNLWDNPDRWVALGLSQVIAILIISIATVALGDSVLALMLLDVKSEQFIYPFNIHNLLHLVFFLGLGDLYVRWRCGSRERLFLKMNLLPEDAETVLQPQDMPPIRQKVAGLHHADVGILPYLADIGILQFLASKSVDQTVKVIDSSLELMAHRVELKYAFCRYLVWAIPTIGFIGTVLHISRALQQINPETPDLGLLTATLGVAFYTTLVALVESAILVFGLQIIEAREELALNDAGQYIMRNLINRLYAG